MRRITVILAGLITSLFLAVLISTGCAATTAVKPPNDKSAKTGGDEKEFDEIIKDFTPITGLLTVYHNPKDGKAYLEIKPEQLDKILLCSVTRSAGEGNFFDSGAMQDNFPFFFRQVGKRMQLIHKNVLFRADRDKPVFRALANGVSDSLISSGAIISKPHPKTKAVLVSLHDLFMTDRYNITQRLNESAKSDFSFDKDNSFFSIIKSFPQNTDIEITMHFRSTKRSSSPTLPDSRSFFLRYYYSVSTLPEDNYRPRLADDRVGHFITMYQDYSSMKTETPYIHYINRWHLEKSDPKLPLSPPKKPIVFWLEKTIPTEYREAVKSGILWWNKAFEKIGFKDAIVVYQQPDDADWDPADVRYNTICWMVSPRAAYAVGPSHEDPFTGQLYAADIRIGAEMLRSSYNEFEEVVNPLALQSQPAGNDCQYARGLAREASFALSLLQARGFLEGKEAEAEKFVFDYLANLVCHEVGHTLGLRHNFKASTMLSNPELHNKKLTGEIGLVGSVMEYAPCNISADPKAQGDFWSLTLGPYDYWVIEYAYKPIDAKTIDEELPQLKEIASRCAEPELIYGTDEDCMGNSPHGIDPACALWDLGNDQLEYLTGRLALARELWSKIEPKFSKPGEGYQKMRRIFRQGIQEYGLAAGLAPRFVGGIYHRRDHIADPSGKIPFELVPAEKQKQALDFIHSRIFSLSEKDLPPAEVLNKLAPERMPDFGGGPDNATSIETQIHNLVLNIQQASLNYLYDPLLLHRLNDNRLRYDKDKEQFTLADLFANLREGIWQELKRSENINSFRRGLQRAHMEKIIQVCFGTTPQLPADAIALARGDLATLQQTITGLLNADNTLDEASKLHLQDIDARITAVLEWKITK